MLSTILIVLLILLLIGALPTWPYSASWGYGPGGLLGTVLVVVLILAFLEEFRLSWNKTFMPRAITHEAPCRICECHARRGIALKAALGADDLPFDIAHWLHREP